MNTPRLLRLALFPILAFAAVHAAAQEWPAKPVRMVIPFPPGGASDYVARALAQGLGETWKQSVVPENRAGARATIGTEAVAKAAPDGYTLLMGVNAGLVIAPHVYSKIGYDPLKDLVPAAGFAVSPMLMVVPVGPVKTVAQLKDAARAQGGKLAYASSGAGALPHLTTEKFLRAAGVQMTHVPYKGSGPALPDLLAGRTQMMIDIIVSALPQVQAGKLHALAVTTSARYAALPDVPTLAESGLPGFEAAQWYAIFAPAGTPPAVLGRIEADIARVTQSPGFAANLLARGAEIAFVPGAKFADVVRRDHAQWAEVVKATGARAD